MSFRYHVVSLAAVLLALAAGVVLGAGPLSGRLNSALAGATASPTSTSSATSIATLRARLTYDDAFAGAVSRQLTAGRLKGQRVVLVVARAIPATEVRPVQQALMAAGATVSGEVDLTPAWTDPTRAAVLSGITDQLAPPDAKGGNGTPQQRAAAALAAAVVTKRASSVGKPSDPATALLAGLVQGGFLTTKGGADRPAGLAVLLVPVGGRDGPALVPLAAALGAAASGTVVAGGTGSGSPDGGVAVVRSDATAGPVLSTVDVVDLPAGRVALVLALAQQRAGGRGDYGSGPGADAPVPRS